MEEAAADEEEAEEEDLQEEADEDEFFTEFLTAGFGGHCSAFDIGLAGREKVCV